MNNETFPAQETLSNDEANYLAAYRARRSGQVLTEGGAKTIDPSLTTTGEAELAHLDAGTDAELNVDSLQDDARRDLANRAINSRSLDLAALNPDMDQDRIDAIKAHNNL